MIGVPGQATAASVDIARSVVAASSVALWLASLALPALDIQHDVAYGWGLFLLGPIGAMLGYLEWCGNIVLFSAWWMLRNDTSRRHDLFTALVLLVTIALAATRRALPFDEGGEPHPIGAHFAGFYLWLASLGLPATHLLHQAFWRKR